VLHKIIKAHCLAFLDNAAAFAKHFERSKAQPACLIEIEGVEELPQLLLIDFSI
jgi:hypothetical protein